MLSEFGFVGQESIYTVSDVYWAGIEESSSMLFHGKMTILPLKRTSGQSLSRQLDEVLIISLQEMIDEESQVAHHPQTVLFVGSCTGVLWPQILSITVYDTPATLESSILPKQTVLPRCLPSWSYLFIISVWLLCTQNPHLEARLIINISHYRVLSLSLRTHTPPHTKKQTKNLPTYVCT